MVDPADTVWRAPVTMEGGVIGAQVDISGGFDPFNERTRLLLPEHEVVMPQVLGWYWGGEAGAAAIAGVTGEALINQDGVALVDVYLSFGIGTSIGVEWVVMEASGPITRE